MRVTVLSMTVLLHWKGCVQVLKHQAHGAIDCIYIPADKHVRKHLVYLQLQRNAHKSAASALVTSDWKLDLAMPSISPCREGKTEEPACPLCNHALAGQVYIGVCASGSLGFPSLACVAYVQYRSVHHNSLCPSQQALQRALDAPYP